MVGPAGQNELGKVLLKINYVGHRLLVLFCLVTMGVSFFAVILGLTYGRGESKDWTFGTIMVRSR